MRTQNETEDAGTQIVGRLRGWTAEPAGITKGWLLLSIVLGWVFLACALFAAVRTVQLDNKVAEEQIRATLEQQISTCLQSNATRAETRIVALADVAEDRRIWVSVDSFLGDQLPEETRTIVFESLAAREMHINETFVDRDCSAITIESDK